MSRAGFAPTKDLCPGRLKLPAFDYLATDSMHPTGFEPVIFTPMRRGFEPRALNHSATDAGWAE
jgi:hypothetical protein